MTKSSVAWRTIHAGQLRSVSSMRHGRENFYIIEEVLRLNEPLPLNIRWDFLLVSIYAGWSRGDFGMSLFTLARNLVR